MVELLTAEEVSKLSNDTTVIITWSGGNGPHEYTIQRDKYGTIIAQMIGETRLFPKNHTVNFVGKERYHTRVKLLSRDKCKHEWKKDYYGRSCKECGLFYPFDCAPWDETS